MFRMVCPPPSSEVIFLGLAMFNLQWLQNSSLKSLR